MFEFFSTCGLKPEKLPQYKTTHHGSKFSNDKGEPQPPPRSFPPFTTVISRLFTSFPPEHLTVRDPYVDFRTNPGIKDWWLGHATNLIQINQTFIITDPVFDDHASPIPYTVRRETPAPRQIRELPQISFVLISHNHWDHLCHNSCVEISQRNPNCHFFVPLRLGSLLQSWGIKNVTEFDWRTKIEIDNIEFTCLPAMHWSSRWGYDAATTLWCSWMMKTNDVLIYYGGDSAIGPHFKEINELFGRGPDLFLVGIGPKMPDEVMRSAHLDGNEAVDMSKNYLKPVKCSPMHYGTFPLGAPHTKTDLEIFIEAVEREQYGDHVILLDVGGRIEYNGTEFVKAA